MSIPRFVLTSSCVMLLVGCFGESTSDKMLRIAQERAVRNRATAEEEAQKVVAVPQRPAKASDVNQRPPAMLASKRGDRNDVPPPAEDVVEESESQRADDETSPSDPNAADVASAETAPPKRDELLAFDRLGGQVAYVGSNNQTIGIYDVASKRVRRQIHNPKLSPLSLSLSENGKLLAAGGIDGGLKIFSLESLEGIDKFQQNRRLRREAAPPRRAHEHPVTAVAINDTVGLAATGSADGEVKLWANDLDRPMELTGNGSPAVKLLSYQEDQWLFAATAEGVACWQIAEQQTEARLFGEGESMQPPTVMVPGPGGKGLAVGDAGGRLTIWTPEGNQLTKKSFSAHDAAIAGVGFADSDDSLVTVSAVGEIVRWKLPIQTQQSFPVVDAPSFVVTSPDRKLMGVPSAERNFDLYQVPEGAAARRHTLRRGRLTAADFSPDGKTVALADGDGRIIFENDKRQPLAFQQLSDAGIEHLVRTTGEDAEFAFATSDGTVGVARFPQVDLQPISSMKGELVVTDASGKAPLVADGSTLRRVRTSDGRVIATSRIGDGTITALNLHENLALVGTSSGSVWLWSQGTPDAKASLLASKVHDKEIKAIGLTRFGSVWTCDAGGRTKQTPLSRESILGRGKVGFGVADVVSLSDGSVVAIDPDGNVRFAAEPDGTYETVSGIESATRLIAGREHVYAISNNGQVLRLVSNDGSPSSPTIRVTGERRIKSVDVSGSLLTVLTSDGSTLAIRVPTGSPGKRSIPGDTFVNGVVSPDGQVIVSRDESGNLYLANVGGSGRALNLPAQSNSRPLALSEAGRFVIVATEGRTLCYEIGRQGPRMARVFGDDLVKPVAACFSADSKHVLFSMPNGDLVTAERVGTDAPKKLATLKKPATKLFWGERIVAHDADGKVTVINDEGSIEYDSGEKHFSAISVRGVWANLATPDGSVYRWKAGEVEPVIVSEGMGAIVAVSGRASGDAITVLDDAGLVSTIVPESGIICETAASGEATAPLIVGWTADHLHAIHPDGSVGSIPIPTVSSLDPAAQLREIAISGDDQWVLGLTTDGSVLRWNQKSGSFSPATQVKGFNGITQIRRLGRGDRFLIVGKENTLSVYSGQSDRVLETMNVDSPVSRIYTSGADERVIVWAGKDVRSLDFRRGTNDSVRSEFARAGNDSHVLFVSGEGRDRWLHVTADGHFISADHISDQQAAGQFTLETIPRLAEIHAGLMFSSAASRVDVYRDDGSRFASVELSNHPIVSLAVDRSSGSFVVSDNRGRIAVRHGDDDSTQKSQLPISDVTSLVWSQEGNSIAATDGNRIVMVNSRNGKVESQVRISTGVDRLVAWQQGSIWFLDRSSRLTRIIPPHVLWSATTNGKLNNLIWSQSGRELIATSSSGDILQLDSSSGKEVRRVPTGKTNLRGLVRIPNAESYALLASTADVLVFDSEGQLADLPISEGLGLRALATSEDGRWLYASDDAGQVLVWALGKLDEPADSVPCDVNCGLLETLGDRLIAVASDESRVALVSASMRLDVVKRLESQPRHVDVSGDGGIVAVADGSTTVSVIALESGEQRSLTADGVTFERVVIAPSGAYIAALGRTDGGTRSRLVIWETIDAREVARTELGSDADMLCYSRDGSLAAVGFADGRVEVFDGINGNMLEIIVSEQKLTTIAFTESGTKLLLGHPNGDVAAHSLMSLGRAKAGESAVVSLSFHGAGKYLLCAGMGGGMTLWNRSAFSAPQAAFRGIASPIACSKVSSDGRYVLAVYDDEENSTFVWDLDTTSSSSEIEPKLIIRSNVKSVSAAFTSDSQFLLIGGTDGMIRAWSLEESREIARFQGHKGSVVDIAPLPTAGHFVSGGSDHSIRSWRFPSSLPPPGAEIPQGALADATEVQELETPELAWELGKRDPYDAARQALISGAGTTDVLDLIQASAKVKQNVKESLSRVLNLEKDKLVDAATLSRERRRLAAAQRRMAPSEDGRILASYSEGFTNLTFAASTNFNFGADHSYRPVRLLFSDRFVYAARPSAASQRGREKVGDKIDIGDNGALLSWDFKYSQLQAHAWSIEDLNVQRLFALPNSAGVFTVPQMVLFNQDGSSRQFPSVASFATSHRPLPARQYLAVGTAGAQRVECDILKIFDIADFTREKVAPYSQYRSFEGVVTAMAFANKSPVIAFCVRERAVHRLFIADAATLQVEQIEEVNHDAPWLNSKADESGVVSRNPNAAPGITSLAFSPDDDLLIAHGQYDRETYRLSRWELDWDDQGELVSLEKQERRELESEGPFFLGSGNESIRFVTRPARFGGDGGYKRILVRVKEGFVVINLNSNRAEQTMPLLKTQHGSSEVAISDDGRWLIMGDDNGMAYVWNTLEGDRYSLTITEDSENLLRDSKGRLKDLVERPAHSGPIVGVALSAPDPGRDYPAFAATIGEENRLKIWELYPILDPETGIRSRSDEGTRLKRMWAARQP